MKFNRIDLIGLDPIDHKNLLIAATPRQYYESQSFLCMVAARNYFSQTGRGFESGLD